MTPTRKPSDDAHPVFAGAEPFAATGGPDAALVLHGFTGNPGSMVGIATALAAAGHAVECPRLPGHGTDIADMLQTTWADWSAEAEAALDRLRAAVGPDGRIVVVGLSMGGALTAWLGTRHADLAGLVFINPVAEPAGPLRDIVQAGIDDGTEVFPGIGSDIADPDVVETAYAGTPLRPLLTLLDAVTDFQDGLAAISCPVLLLNSPQDHVVPPSNSDHLAASVRGPVERVTLERSYHVATLDHDKDLIVDHVVAFAAKVFAR
jgi:carboxylesterase